MKVFFSSILTSLLLLLFIDFFFGNKILDYLYSFDSINSPLEKKKKRLDIEKNEKSYRVKNPYFHHTLKPNVKTKSFWGNIEYNTCTNSHGFRTSCKKNKDKDNSFQIVFIGDSFTEGLGLPYDDTFVGIIANKLKEKKIANLAVSGYSPSIYYIKIKHLFISIRALLAY